MRRNRVVVGLLLWLTAVTTVAGLAWFAIDSAGKSVTALPVSQAGSSVEADPTPEPTRQVETSSTTVPAPAPSSAPTGLSTGVASSSAPTSSAPTASTRTSSPSRTTTKPRPSTPPPAPKQIRATKSEGWGTVTIACQSGRVSLVSASPSFNWTMKVESSGPPQVEVSFSPKKGKPVTVDGVCSGGRPDISVDEDD